MAKPLQGRPTMARVLEGQPGPLQGRPAASRAACKGGRSRAWLAPSGAMLAGIGSTRKGDAPFGDDASPQGWRLRSQRPQELPGNSAHLPTRAVTPVTKGATFGQGSR
ncbi:hypothetical protein B296_00052041 [Ensete ventricosum]|uniref:Uncharacterized protein n=1 Tax=Ensete ventricosum TaxID=4639 RepID=A0A426WXR9_ENSVE|nr:hypothetical protein B296_00052041 [Ensete ventricosum]